MSDLSDVFMTLPPPLVTLFPTEPLGLRTLTLALKWVIRPILSRYWHWTRGEFQKKSHCTMLQPWKPKQRQIVLPLLLLPLKNLFGGVCKFSTHCEHTHFREAFSANSEQEVGVNQLLEFSAASAGLLPSSSSARLFVCLLPPSPPAAPFLRLKRAFSICSQCAKAVPKAHCKWKSIYAKKCSYCHVYNNACLFVRTNLSSRDLVLIAYSFFCFLETWTDSTSGQ